MMTQADIELLERYIDGTLAESDVEPLQTLLRDNAEARAMLRSLATVDFGLQDIAANAATADGVDGEGRPSLPEPNALATKRSLPLYARTLLAIATVVIVALTTSLYVQRASYERKFLAVSAKSDRRIGKITGLGGVVMWTGDGGRVTSDLSVGTELTGGTIEGASPTSWVELEFLDGSTVTVCGDSRLTFSDFGQKVLHLKEGNVASKVSPQSAANPMLVHTRTAMLEVLGTEFNVESEVDATSLNVTEGKVRLKRLSDGRTVDVPANQRVVAASRSELTPQQIPESVSRWKSQLQVSPDRVLGKWIPKTNGDDARLKTIPYLHTTPQGQLMTVFAAGLQVSDGDDAFVILRPDSRIRVRGRLEQAHSVVFFGVTVRHSIGRHGGNFMTFNPALAPDGEGRFEVVLKARDLRLDPLVARLKEDLAATPIEMIVEAFWCSTPTDAAGLEIVEVEIFQSGNK
ncbi:MAG: hypothetical protein CMJ64_02500 [Planctomycetaceae bacterium]|nr:hypothetical protein [Planctomycetaceae bacterium]